MTRRRTSRVFVLLNGAGGECLEDFQQLRQDAVLAELIGHGFPSPEAARQFLYCFTRRRDQEAQLRRQPGEIAYIPEESAALAGLGRVNRDLVQRLGTLPGATDRDGGSGCHHHREPQAGGVADVRRRTGYQPMLAVWAEMDVVLADEFRDGNVPAIMAPLTVAKRAFAALPETVQTYYFRGDSACHENDLLNWLRHEERAGGPQGCLGFAISARMTEALREAIGALPEEEWKPYGESHPNESRACAEVPFVPAEKSEHKDSKPLRYVAIRITKKQGELFEDGVEGSPFRDSEQPLGLVRTRLLQWHREKAGTIEAVHDVVKNELAGGVLPCKYFGANAAWLRLAVITHNLLTALKRLALPAELLRARPKRLRFLIFNTPGKPVHHARQTLLRLRGAWHASATGEVREIGCLCRLADLRP